jgi:hypothetical protein
LARPLTIRAAVLFAETNVRDEEVMLSASNRSRLGNSSTRSSMLAAMLLPQSMAIAASLSALLFGNALHFLQYLKAGD